MASSAPFGEGKKKSEFPDAIVDASFVAYANEQEVQVTILSRDGDMRRACEGHSEHLTLGTSLSAVLGEAWLADEEAGHEAIASALSGSEASPLPLELVREHLENLEVTFDRYEATRSSVRVFSRTQGDLTWPT